MLAEAPLAENAHHLHRQRIGAGRQHVAAIDRQPHQHAILGQVGTLEVQHHPIGKADLADAEARFGGIGHDLPGRAEIGIGKGPRSLGLGRGDRGLDRRIPGRAQRLGPAVRFAPALEPDQRLVEWHQLTLQRRHDRLGRDLRDEGFQPFE